MSIILENKFLSLEIQEPGKVYRKARFDWTGQIIQITYKSKYTFCTTESLNKKLTDEQGRGLYNEFGIDKPVGYESCAVGSDFPKIGIGLLNKKSSEPYNFFENYSISPYSFSHIVKKNSAEFICITNEKDEYTFRLNKKIRLKEDKFFIEYELSNFGNKPIITNEYVHNFISINNRYVDKRYKLTFPFKIITTGFEECVNPGNVVKIQDNSITWNSMPENQFFFGKVNAGYSGKGMWTLVDLEEKIGISESADFDIQKMNLWGATHVISPEIFFEINLLPGKSLRWKRTYSVFSI